VTEKEEVEFLRRDAAGEYIKRRFGFGSAGTLAQLASKGGGPPFCRAGNACLYRPADLDEWALGKIGAPRLSADGKGAAKAEK
jgi:hypothetical protein